MAWGPLQTATQLTSITTEQFFSFGGVAYITLNPGELADIQVDINFPLGAADHGIISCYSTMDDSSENWDDTPFLSIVADKGTDPNGLAFQVTGKYKFRIGVKRSGSSDTIVSADCKYRKDGVSL